MTVAQRVAAAGPFELALRIRHPAIDPADISHALGLEPVHAFKAGQPKSSRSAGWGPAVHAESYWLGSLGALPVSTSLLPEDSPLRLVHAAYARAGGRARQDLGMALYLALLTLARTHAEFLAQVRADGGQATLIVTVTGPLDGFAITPEMSRMLERAGLALEFEFGEG
jgi:hypothetical protein